MAPVPLTPENTIFFCCDLQTKFGPAIQNFDQVVATANRMVKLAKILEIPVVATIQYGKVLGPVDPGVGLDTLGPLHLGTIDKLLFSMVTEDLVKILDERPHIQNVVIFGIEAQICVLQTTLSLLSYSRPIKPYIIADGVSSSNAFEIPILFDRLRQEGAIVTTTQSFGYQIVGSATHSKFKAFAQYNKETGEAGNLAGKTLLGHFAPKI